jgi:hypothetical protein
MNMATRRGFRLTLVLISVCCGADLLVSTAHAAPAIDSITASDGATHGSTITISGSGFRDGAKILFFDDFEGGVAKVDEALVTGTVPKVGDEWRDRTHFPTHCHGSRGYDTRSRFDSSAEYLRHGRSSVSVKHRVVYDEDLFEQTEWNQCDWSLIEAYWAGGTYPGGPDHESEVYVTWFQYLKLNPDGKAGYGIPANWKLWGFDEDTLFSGQVAAQLERSVVSLSAYELKGIGESVEIYKLGND